MEAKTYGLRNRHSGLIPRAFTDVTTVICSGVVGDSSYPWGQTDLEFSPLIILGVLSLGSDRFRIFSAQAKGEFQCLFFQQTILNRSDPEASKIGLTPRPRF